MDEVEDLLSELAGLYARQGFREKSMFWREGIQCLHPPTVDVVKDWIDDGDWIEIIVSNNDGSKTKYEFNKPDIDVAFTMDEGEKDE
jgi:hypothetical protein